MPEPLPGSSVCQVDPTANLDTEVIFGDGRRRQLRELLPEHERPEWPGHRSENAGGSAARVFARRSAGLAFDQHQQSVGDETRVGVELAQRAPGGDIAIAAAFVDLLELVEARSPSSTA